MSGRIILRIRPLETLLLALSGGFAAVFLVLTKDYNSTAALFPRWVAVASLLLLAALVFQLLNNTESSSGAAAEKTGDAASGVLSRRAVFAIQGAYIFLIYFLGFLVATLLFLVIVPIQMGYRRWGVVLVHGVVLTLAVVGSFLWLFNIRLPAGVIWDLW